MPLHRPVRAIIRTSLLVIGSLTIANCSSTAADEAFQQVAVCPYNDAYRCDRHTHDFLSPPPIIMINADIADIPNGTTITVEWGYQGGELKAMDIQTTTFEKSDPDITSMYAVLTQPDDGWPTGTYEVVLSTNWASGKTTQSFSIFNDNSSANAERSNTNPDSPRPTKFLQNVVLCQLDALDIDGNCVSEISIVPQSSPGVRLEAAMPTAPVGTTVVINWRYINESVGRSEDIQTVTRLKDNSTANQIEVRLARPPSGWQSGIYEVVLTIPGSNSEMERKQFIVQ